ncbi:4,5-DOPA dioxygenase extradiol [Hymenobacter lucidus]|uniref:4,5-DOPA dioxygenase extradiol n=1 Tax=Hymenobacter lucidus TaxID=2880930 RepID=A0ABS8ARJ6_9BACT|nr:4,5-DOPA dioxygenase extradiol [Hymenobacter lucidus]MCB2408719.1 4,5-DOPA dioxygenase extradiol [Hymenobacter lucidus]
MNLHDIHKTATSFSKTERMPVLFVGHGSPMNALEDNAFTRRMKQLGREIRQRQTPNAILVVSAHWLTRGTLAGINEKPETIHDFGGFPQELFAMQYPAPGAPDFARSIIEHVADVHGSDEWGLDHGTWTVLHHLFPEATIPVFQLSLDVTKSMQQHFDLARQLQFLRERGVLIIGSGNIVHNLRQSMPKLMQGDATPYDWATEFDEWVKVKIDQRDFASLVNYQQAGGSSAQLSVPTTDHYLPVLYSLGLADKDENIVHTFEEVSYGGLSMRTFMAG